MLIHPENASPEGCEKQLFFYRKAEMIIESFFRFSAATPPSLRVFLYVHSENAGTKKERTAQGVKLTMKSMMKEMKINELNMEELEIVAGGTPMSIPGGKRSGRKNSETALEMLNWLGEKCNSLLEDLGLKEKPVNNSIVDKTVKDYQ